MKTKYPPELFHKSEIPLYSQLHSTDWSLLGEHALLIFELISNSAGQ